MATDTPTPFSYIYLNTNLINGRKYIGQKKSKEFLGEKYLGSGKILKQSVKKNGTENFEKNPNYNVDSKNITGWECIRENI